VTDEGVVCLVMKCGHHLSRLNLSFCNTLTDTSMKSLGYHCPIIQNLNVQGDRNNY
jgi:F-box/leucine-rich repeat protein 2/20